MSDEDDLAFLRAAKAMNDFGMIKLTRRLETAESSLAAERSRVNEAERLLRRAENLGHDYRVERDRARRLLETRDAEVARLRGLLREVREDASHCPFCMRPTCAPDCKLAAALTPEATTSAVPADRIICDTPGCGREIPEGGEGCPEICPTCLACLEFHGERPRTPAVPGGLAVFEEAVARVLPAVPGRLERARELLEDAHAALVLYLGGHTNDQANGEVCRLHADLATTRAERDAERLRADEATTALVAMTRKESEAAGRARDAEARADAAEQLGEARRVAANDAADRMLTLERERDAERERANGALASLEAAGEAIDNRDDIIARLRELLREWWPEDREPHSVLAKCPAAPACLMCRTQDALAPVGAPLAGKPEGGTDAE